jgi:hypothetical protein
VAAGPRHSDCLIENRRPAPWDAGSRMRAVIKTRLIERREWPNGPFWRTAAGNRLVRAWAKVIHRRQGRKSAR